ncbi:MAG TPA: hypothetical protein VGW78_04610 [Candidatus Babeliales bacterium]|jgi:hypothetical protein|nr:hypothetical protein [Candidatus Babeliales bacterium]
MNTKKMLLSLSLLASIPSALLYAAEEVATEESSKAPTKASHRIRRLLRKVLLNQRTIIKTLREILGYEELTTDVKSVLAHDEARILAIIVENQYEIISMLGTIAGSDINKDLASRSASLQGIPLVLVNQQIIITLLHQILNHDVEKFDEVTVENDAKGLKAVIENQDKIIAMVKEVQATRQA